MSPHSYWSLGEAGCLWRHRCACRAANHHNLSIFFNFVPSVDLVHGDIIFGRDGGAGGSRHYINSVARAIGVLGWSSVIHVPALQHTHCSGESFEQSSLELYLVKSAGEIPHFVAMLLQLSPDPTVAVLQSARAWRW